jgi:hypothetical protein
MEVPAEARIVDALRNFDRDRTSQVMAIEGTQGVGKTSLLNYYQSELQAFYEDAGGFYIIRYYPDPEASFDGILRRIFQEVHQAGLLAEVGKALSPLDPGARSETLSLVNSGEVRLVLLSLCRSAKDPTALASTADLAFEWLSGMRVLNRHREALNVHFRLDTVESKNQALRDMVFCCSHLRLLNGIFLLLDELEKQDYSLSKTVVLRYLSAIRALIDALPRHLFLLVALTIEARRRYFGMLPAFAGRLQNVVVLKALLSSQEALDLYSFYVEKTRERAQEEALPGWGTPGNSALLDKRVVGDLFEGMLQRAKTSGSEGVGHRDFLNALHLLFGSQMQPAGGSR